MNQQDLNRYVELLEETLDLISQKEIHVKLLDDLSIEVVNFHQEKIRNLELQISDNMFWVTELKRLRPKLKSL